METQASAVSTATKIIRVAVCGGKGKMGQEVVKTVINDPELQLAGVVDLHSSASETVNQFFSVTSENGMCFDQDLKSLLAREKPDVCVDFTNPDVVFGNTMAMIEAGCRPVIGTTGLSQAQLAEIDAALRAKDLGGMVVPNFAIGAVLMMKFAQEAAKYFDHAEIIELHHNKKADAPSGTAIKTAELMRQSQVKFGPTNAPEKETISGARGATGPADIHIHSVRLPGYIAHQEVILGGPGQILTIRHDSMDRASFMPGVALASKKVMGLTGLVYGLEHIL
jgi:4-hydroxy-tetrahydrodipicolinate reductase